MYIDIENILPTVATFLLWYIIMAIPSGLCLLLLTLYGKRKGKVPSDADTQKIVLEGMAIWPKIYYLFALGLARMVINFLWQLAKDDEPSAEDEANAFTMLFQQRLNDNQQLVDYLTNDDGDSFIEIKANHLSGTTYIALHGNPDFLESIRESDGSYDDESMERFRSLQPWMVFDLICAHPHYKDLLPPEIISQISTRH